MTTLHIEIDLDTIASEVNEAVDKVVETSTSIRNWIEQNPAFIQNLCQDAFIESLVEKYEFG